MIKERNGFPRRQDSPNRINKNETTLREIIVKLPTIHAKRSSKQPKRKCKSPTKV